MLILVEMLFADYQSYVLEDYEKKKAAGDLSHRILHLTPSKLKDECEAVCRQRYERKDDKTLEEFFGGPGGDKDTWLRAIHRCETDKFKPLVNFLRGNTGKTEEKNIELLAWLIDFRPRPCEAAKKYFANGVDVTGTGPEELARNDREKEGDAGLAGEPGLEEGEEVPTQMVFGKPAPNFGVRRIIIAAVIMLALGIGIYRVWFKSPTIVYTGPQGCMYWTGDHYEQVSCNQKVIGAMVIALDSERLNNFKKITLPDTITESSIGKIWCVKVNGNYEYYTSDGFHPIDQRLRLRRLSEFIFRNHIHGGQ
ncbi:MAG TPA: hypothetical protein VHD83_19145 [Puia sp.]|nr:hypothetical protein [Puia sp.]